MDILEIGYLDMLDMDTMLANKMCSLLLGNKDQSLNQYVPLSSSLMIITMQNFAHQLSLINYRSIVISEIEK